MPQSARFGEADAKRVPDDRKQSVWSLSNVHLGPSSSRLNDITLGIGRGRTAILGCSGAGKSSLLGVLADFERPATGTMSFQPASTDGQLPLFWSPQDHGLWPHLTAEEHLIHVRPDFPRIERHVSQWLAAVDLADLTDTRPDRMSQGERSRLSLVRTLASEAWAMLFDEPLTHVGPTHAADCWRLILEAHEQLGGPLVYSTHDPDAVLRFADDVVCLDSGRVIYSGSVNQLHFNPPDRRTGELLGPLNWFASDDATLPEPMRSDWPSCVRPFELRVVSNADGPFEVTHVRAIAGLLEVEVEFGTDRSETTISTTLSGSRPEPGDTVRFEFLAAPERE